ncbi:MAG: hypothetical protein D6761_07145 [Candidatus Dadabacteria bacterium]|nr:MAG: hypothetical protein D6761_07145 [Candidatus Dadabacteria bacterium]
MSCAKHCCRVRVVRTNTTCAPTLRFVAKRAMPCCARSCTVVLTGRFAPGLQNLVQNGITSGFSGSRASSIRCHGMAIRSRRSILRWRSCLVSFGRVLSRWLVRRPPILFYTPPEPRSGVIFLPRASGRRGLIRRGSSFGRLPKKLPRVAGSSSSSCSTQADPKDEALRTWFLALPVRDGADILRALTPPPEGVHFLHELDLHLTLAFLGRRSRADAERAWDRIRDHLLDLARDHAALSAARVVPMGPVTRFSALAVEPEPDEAAARVAAAMRTCARQLRDFGVTMHRDGPRPHVTIARISRNAPMPVRHRAIAWAEAQSVRGLALRCGAPTLYCRERDPDTGTCYREVLRLSA